MKRTYTLTKFLCGLSLILMGTQSAPAQDNSDNKEASPAHNTYVTTGIDGLILSTSLLSKNGGSSKLTTPRFTGFLHIGILLHYDFSRHFGVYTGLGIKNIGFIEKTGDWTTIRRDYTFGIPLGLKIGNIASHDFVTIGGGIDFPFNYREKTFIKRGHKQKFNEWFSNRTPAAMSYVFLGAHLYRSVTLKLQYYPGNFLNPEFSEVKDGVTINPYKGYKVNLVLLSFGFNIPYHPREIGSSMRNQIKTTEI